MNLKCINKLLPINKKTMFVFINRMSVKLSTITIFFVGFEYLYLLISLKRPSTDIQLVLTQINTNFLDN